MRRKTVAKAIIVSKNKLLFQLRDNKPTIPFPNTWSLFGGGVEQNELPADALIRELNEELNLQITEPKLFMHRERIEKDFEVDEWIYIVNVSSLELKDTLETTEGKAAQFFSAEELTVTKINPLYVDVINKYAPNNITS